MPAAQGYTQPAYRQAGTQQRPFNGLEKQQRRTGKAKVVLMTSSK